MASITLAATMHTPTSELRPATIDRILVIEHHRAFQKILISRNGWNKSAQT